MKIKRFKEFDEARSFIEAMKPSKDTFDAIDYMITHKEFYFLLKNLAEQNVDKKIVDYIFFNLPCLKREEDYEVFFKLLDKYKSSLIDYLKSCKNFEFAKMLVENGVKEGVDVLMLSPDFVDYLKNLKTKNKELKEKIKEYLEIYGE